MTRYLINIKFQRYDICPFLLVKSGSIYRFHELSRNMHWIYVISLHHPGQDNVREKCKCMSLFSIWESFFQILFFHYNFVSHFSVHGIFGFNFSVCCTFSIPEMRILRLDANYSWLWNFQELLKYSKLFSLLFPHKNVKWR